MSSYLGHSIVYDPNQFRVLLACLIWFHSKMCLPFSLFVSTNSSRSDSSIESTHSIQWSLNIQCKHCLFKVLYIILQSLIRIQSLIDSAPSFTTTQIGLASMFQSTVVSMLRMKIRYLWEWNGPNWVNRVWFNVQNRNVSYLIIL